MKKVLVFGAGKSATVLLDYLLAHAVKESWQVIVVDAAIQLATQKINGSPNGTAVSFDINNATERERYISDAAIVISMLPPTLHSIVANDCVKFSRHLLTASYLDAELRKLEPLIKEKGVIFLCEMGLDPGIDHMSAMMIIDEIHAKGGRITSFKSHCGGLVAPESDNNPWHYKISWNPRNIVLAGKAGAHYRESGKEVQLDYANLFDIHKKVTVPDVGDFGWYPNRDSLSYTTLYGLENAGTFVRTTLRHPDFMSGWSNIVHLQLTDETPNYYSDGKTLQQLFREHLDRHNLHEWIQEKMKARFTASPADSAVAAKMIEQLTFLGFDDDETIVNKGFCSAADILQFAVEKKLALQEEDKDMIVMLHEFEYLLNDKTHTIKSSLVVKGENRLHTAMAKTVGLPLGIAARLILNGQLQMTGLHIPTHPEIYLPVLQELEAYAIRFVEE